MVGGVRSYRSDLMSPADTKTILREDLLQLPEPVRSGSDGGGSLHRQNVFTDRRGRADAAAGQLTRRLTRLALCQPSAAASSELTKC